MGVYIEIARALTQNNKKKEVINFTYLVDELLSFLKKKLEGLAEGREIVENYQK